MQISNKWEKHRNWIQCENHADTIHVFRNICWKQIFKILKLLEIVLKRERVRERKKKMHCNRYSTFILVLSLFHIHIVANRKYLQEKVHTPEKSSTNSELIENFQFNWYDLNELAWFKVELSSNGSSLIIRLRCVSVSVSVERCIITYMHRFSGTLVFATSRCCWLNNAQWSVLKTLAIVACRKIANEYRKKRRKNTPTTEHMNELNRTKCNYKYDYSLIISDHLPNFYASRSVCQELTVRIC